MPCSPGMRGCHARCLHRALVLAYRDARDQWERMRETSADLGGGAQMEHDEWSEHSPPPTFKQWLEDQERHDDDAA